MSITLPTFSVEIGRKKKIPFSTYRLLSERAGIEHTSVSFLRSVKSDYLDDLSLIARLSHSHTRQHPRDFYTTASRREEVQDTFEQIPQRIVFGHGIDCTKISYRFYQALSRHYDLLSAGTRVILPVRSEDLFMSGRVLLVLKVDTNSLIDYISNLDESPQDQSLFEDDTREAVRKHYKLASYIRKNVYTYTPRQKVTLGVADANLSPRREDSTVAIIDKDLWPVRIIIKEASDEHSDLPCYLYRHKRFSVFLDKVGVGHKAPASKPQASQLVSRIQASLGGVSLTY